MDTTPLTSMISKKNVENQAKMYILCSPHNPVGRVWKEEELKKLMDICQRHGVMVTADEIHQDIVFGENVHHPAPGIAGGKYKDNIILMTSTSKTFNLAGLKNSYAVIPSEEKRKIFDDFNVYPHVDTGCTLSYIASAAAYRHGSGWLKDLLNVIHENYQYMCDTFAAELPDVRVTPLEGTYLSWIDLRAYAKPEDTQKVVQKKAKVAVDYGNWFSEKSAGFIHMNLGTSREIVA